MKLTRLALAGKWGCFGRRSYVRSFAIADSAANRRSCCNMEFTAIAPNPTAASCKARLRVMNLFMALSPDLGFLVTIQEIIGPKHCLDEQPQTFLLVRFCRNGLSGDFLFLGSWRPIVSHIEC